MARTDRTSSAKYEYKHAYETAPHLDDAGAEVVKAAGYHAAHGWELISHTIVMDRSSDVNRLHHFVSMIFRRPL